MSLAQFDDPEQAKAAYYGEDGPPGEDGEGGEDGWTEWTRIQQAGKWILYGQEKIPATDVRYYLTGKLPDGSQVYLNTDGKVVDERAILESMKEVNAALQKYRQRVENGNVPDNRQPTGSDPGPGNGGGGGGASGLLGSVLGALPGGPMISTLLLLAIIAGAYYYYQRSGGDLELPSVGGNSIQ